MMTRGRPIAPPVARVADPNDGLQPARPTLSYVIVGPTGRTHRRRRRLWRSPRKDRLFDADSIEGYVDWGDDEREEFVPTALIIGSTFRHEVFDANWSLFPPSSWNDKKQWDWHNSKLARLMEPSEEGGFDQVSALTKRGGHNLCLHEVDGLYFVSSGGNHRVAAAHQKGIGCLRANVLHGKWKSGTPLKIKRWFEKTRYRLLEGSPMSPRHSKFNHALRKGRARTLRASLSKK